MGTETAEIRWRVEGVVLDEVSTDRGRSLLIATQGGAAQRVVDASTGRTIVGVSLQPGAVQTLRLVANGVVVQAVSDGGSVRRAVDLNGTALWDLPGSGGLVVGDGVVGELIEQEVEGVTSWQLVVHGDPDAAGFMMGAGFERHPQHGQWHRS